MSRSASSLAGDQIAIAGGAIMEAKFFTKRGKYEHRLVKLPSVLTVVGFGNSATARSF